MSIDAPQPSSVDAPQWVTGADALEIAREEYRHGSVERAWEAVQAATTIGREIDDALLVADAASVITGPAIGAWSFTAQRHALCREALTLLGDRDPMRADVLRALLVVTASPWVNGIPDGPNPISAVDAERRSAELHARHSAAIGIDGLSERLACADELALLAGAASRHEDAAWAALWRADAFSELGMRVELNAEFTTLTDIVARLDSPAWNWRVAAGRVTLAVLDGHLDDAPGLIVEAQRLGSEAGVAEAPFLDLIVRSNLAVQSGVGLPEIEDEVRRALIGAPFFAQGWRARVLLAMGRTDDALEIWRALAPRLGDLPTASPEWLVATMGHVELSAAAGDLESAAVLIDQLLPYAELNSGGLLTPYGGPVSFYLAILAETLGRHTAARDYWTDAVARSERMHSPSFAAAARAGLAALTVGPLSLRELEVAGLVAEGQTNRQIAARLVLSERTVENHVSNILRKLGVNTRSGIAARL